MTEALIEKLGYLGISLLLVLGGLGLPVPEEAPIILAAVLSKSERMWWPFALASCFIGVLLGDFIVYFIGYYYGDKVLSLPMTRKLLTLERETQIKGYFHRHGFKILILGRFAVGFRTAAYLTAGILQLPVLKLFLTDVLAASLSTLLMFGLGYVFANQIEGSFDQMKHWLMAIVALVLASWLLHRFHKGRLRAGLRVGPPVLVSDDAPLPLDDLHAHPETTTDPVVAVEPIATPEIVVISPPVAPEQAPSVAPPPSLDPGEPIVAVTLTITPPNLEPAPTHRDPEVAHTVDPNRPRSLETRPR
ncbi:VTT domain-containing protein [Singulisphaera sp. GP187]|uniref:VTT domain-containing protein n=1 Tax=Singulisphaera sp. GP187 TaxID=1882752 RepID=UPI000940B14F|nr:VTT domain-containing protein [Singulisphaera sp. GP187]